MTGKRGAAVKEPQERENQDLRTEVRALQQQVQALLAAQHSSRPTGSRWRVSKSLRFVWLPIGLVLAAGGVHYGQGAMDAFFIDQQGRIGIGTTTPEHVVDIRKGDQKAPFAVDNALFLDRQKDTVRMTNNAYVNESGNWQIKDPQKKAFTLELRDTGMLELYGTVTNGQADWRKLATFDAANNAIRLQAPVTLNGVSFQNALVPLGTIMAYGGDTLDPKIVEQLKTQGWLPCDGALVLRSEYGDLGKVLGNAFGASTDKQFRVPDLRGRFPRGTNQNTGRDPDAGTRRADPAGGNSGDNVGSVQDDEFKSHSHGYRSADHETPRNGTFSGNYWANKNSQTTATGGKETRPKNLYVNWIIKAKHT